MTYLAAHDAKTVVWIAEAFADEHRAALTWLNDNTPEDVGFYGVVPRLMRIAGSPPGLRIEVVIAPNTFVKQQKREERKIDSEIADVREGFWRSFNRAIEADEVLNGCRRRYGGRLGFQWLLPEVGGEWAADEPHVLVYIQAGRGRQAIGVVLECRKGARPESDARLHHARERLQARGVALGSMPANLTDTAATEGAVTELVSKAKVAAEELLRAFA